MVSRVVAYEDGGKENAVPVFLEFVSAARAENRQHRYFHLVRLTHVPKDIGGAMQIKGVDITHHHYHF